MSNVSASQQNKSDIRNLFDNMNWSSAVESGESALAWVKQHDSEFRGFVQGHPVVSDILRNGKQAKLQPNTVCDNTGKHICCVYTSVDDVLLSHAAEVTFNSFKFTSSVCPRMFLNIAENLEKCGAIFTYLEALSSGKHISKTKSKDFQNLVESFRCHASVVYEAESETNSWCPQGPVCVVAEEHHNPLLMLSVRIGSLLASGNSVLILCHWKSLLSVFLLAEICHQSGVPDGVINVLPVDQVGSHFIETSFFSKFIFSGSFDRCVSYSQLCSETQIPCEFLIPKRPVVIVYENSDLHSAANGVLEAFFYHDTRSCSGGCKVMIQESISEKFSKILSDYFEKISVDQNMSYSDMSGIVTEDQKKELSNYVKEAVKFNVKITAVHGDIKQYDYCQMTPVLISNLPTNFKLVHEELGGPIIVTTHFRTVKESISMFNCDNRGSPVSIWTEKISVALEVASKLKTATVWVNSENLVDPSVPFTGIYMSGNSVEGGKEGCFSHMNPFPPKKNTSDQMDKYRAWLTPKTLAEFILPGKITEEDTFKETENKTSGNPIENKITRMKEYKLFIGGDLISCSKLDVLDDSTIIPSAKASDVQKAVSSALAAQPAWERHSNSERRKVIFAISKALQKFKEKCIVELQEYTSFDEKAIKKEIDQSLAVLYHWAMKIEESCNQGMKKNLFVLQNRCPRGVIGIQCPDEGPLLSFISLVVPAIVHGNTVVVIPSSKYPTVALKMSEIFQSANVPAGVINTVCGDKTILVPALCKHTDVNAIWFADAPIRVINSHCNITQRVFNCTEICSGSNLGEEICLKFILESTFSKVIYLPSGEIFAN